MAKYNFEWEDLDDLASVVADAATVLASRWWPIIICTFLFFFVSTGVTVTVLVRQYLLIRYLHEEEVEENRADILDMLKFGD